MFDKSWNSQMHKMEIADLAKRNLHVFRVNIEDHGIEEVLFQGISREQAAEKLNEWISNEPFVHLEE